VDYAINVKLDDVRHMLMAEEAVKMFKKLKTFVDSELEKFEKLKKEETKDKKKKKK
jgi:hypothetical protein